LLGFAVNLADKQGEKQGDISNIGFFGKVRNKSHNLPREAVLGDDGISQAQHILGFNKGVLCVVFL